MYCECFNIRVSNIYRITFEIIVLVMFHKFRSCQVQLLHTGKSQGFIQCGYPRCVCKPTKVAPSGLSKSLLLAKNCLLIRGGVRNFCLGGLICVTNLLAYTNFHTHTQTHASIHINKNEYLL